MKAPVPFLWFEKDAEQAANFYVSLLPDSRIDSVTALPADSPSGPAGSVQIVAFTLAGQPWKAMNAGRHDPFNHAVSFVIECDSQEEIDRLWTAILENGGKEQACGWILDRWGVAWQITPKVIFEMYQSANPDGAKRAAEAMLKMVKFDIAALEKAFNGD